MWQRITGRIEVLDDIVRVEIDLPWIMQLLRDTVAKQCGGVKHLSIGQTSPETRALVGGEPRADRFGRNPEIASSSLYLTDGVP
jgi:hypothetical protein